MLRVVRNGSKRLEYELRQTGRKDILFHILPGQTLKVYAPQFMHLRAIDEIVRKRMDEMLDKQAELDAKLSENNAEHPVADGSDLHVCGKTYKLKLICSSETELSIEDGICCLKLPRPEDATAVREALRRGFVDLALKTIPARLRYWAPRLGVSYGRVTLRDQETRWGSCSAKHNLNFNWRIILAPPEVLDYVVIHELCHLLEFNHSPRFWKLVESQMPDYSYWKNWLKQHADDLHAYF